MKGTRAEHLAWCKQRAREEITSGDYMNAVASMLSDLGKHPETANSAEIGGMLLLTVHDERTARAFIEGFN